jgi:hypothetical protein
VSSAKPGDIFWNKFEETLQLFFKYFPIRNLVFEKTGADDVVWFIKGRVVCGLPGIHAPKRTLGII